MASWDEYTQKATPEDADTLLIKDTAGAANKRTPFSGVWTWIVNKMTNAVIANLETTNKMIIPAINELNSKSYLLRGGMQIPSGADMDEYITPGNYYCGGNNTVQTLANCPFTHAFTLKVQFGNGEGYPSQTFHEFDTGRIAWRWRNTNLQWSDWFFFSDDATLFVGTSIQSGDDLNDYKTPGTYCSPQGGITQTLLNMPEIFNSAFTMLIFNPGGQMPLQVIIRGGTTDAVYIRILVGDVWRSWYKFSGTPISS